MTFAVYNEIEPFAVKWLRALIEAGELSNGIVNETDVRTLDPETLREATRVHLFAGIGGWDYALNLAGWPADRPVWTGSCPCQPFSSAGRAGGVLDERHLWPAFRGLVAECCPPVIFGEQVASADGRAWLAGVRADLERMGYAVGAADLPAACVGAPHIRQRLFWVADRIGERIRPEPEIGHSTPPKTEDETWQRERRGDDTEHGGEARRMADAQHERARPGATGFQGEPRKRRRGPANRGGLDHASSSRLEPDRIGEPQQPEGRERLPGVGCPHGGLGDSAGAGRQGHRPELPARRDQQLAAEPDARSLGLGNPASDGRQQSSEGGRQGQSDAQWASSDLVHCRDGRSRRIEPGTFPLAHGIPGRVGRLRGYGNAIVPQVAALFIQAYLSSTAQPPPD